MDTFEGKNKDRGGRGQKKAKRNLLATVGEKRIVNCDIGKLWLENKKRGVTREEMYEAHGGARVSNGGGSGLQRSVKGLEKVFTRT